MEEQKIFYSLISELWKTIKGTLNTKTEEEWRELDDKLKALVNKPEYRPIQQLVIDWCLAYMNYLEEKRKNETQKQRPTGQRGEADTKRG